MFRFETGVRLREWWFAIAAATLVALAAVWLQSGSSSPELADDYENCVERVQSSGGNATSDETTGALGACEARFAGRRKPGGGYSYYDFMQDRKFDIEGPNPTADERKAIDREYIGYLESQRREAISVALAKQQNEQLRVDLETARQPAGPPLALAPVQTPAAAAAAAAAKRSKSRRCMEDTIFCTLSKFSTAVKDAFASSPKAKN